MISACVKLKCR